MPVNRSQPNSQPTTASLSRHKRQPSVRHDRLTLTCYSPGVIWCLLLGSVSAAIPMLARDLHVNQATAGLNASLVAFGMVITGLAMPLLVKRFGRRRLLVAPYLVCAVALLTFALGQSLVVSLVAVLLAASGAACTMAVALTVLVAHHGKASPAALAEFTIIGVALGLLAPPAISAAETWGLGWRAAFGLIALLTALAGWLFSRLPVDPSLDAVASVQLANPATQPAEPPANSSPSAPSGNSNHDQPPNQPNHKAPSDNSNQPPTSPLGGGKAGLFWGCVIVTMLEQAAEATAIYWAAKYVANQTTLSLAGAALAVTLVMAGQVVGRLVIRPLALRLATLTLLAASAGVVILGWLALWNTHQVWLALLGVFVIGVGLGPGYPLGVDLALHHSPWQLDRAQGRFQLVAGAGAALAPFAAGALADQVGIHNAFLVVPALSLIGLLAIGLLFKELQKAQRNSAA
ncbi:MAG: MFS transporter [Bifidobacteriaceae bacterium]|jgi:fucose permease|nr:MFS transporter [Bifidobacteriaceae bacterium]